MVTTITKGGTQFYEGSHHVKKREERIKEARRKAQERLAKAEGTAESPKEFEVSTKGDSFGKQFSALNATFESGPYAGRTIEDIWQKDIKESGKGQAPGKGSILRKDDYAQSKAEYQKLWQMWGDENPDLISELKAKVDEGYVLKDSWATGDPNKTVNQAEALTNVLNQKTIEAPEVKGVTQVEHFWNRPEVAKDTGYTYLFGDNTHDRTETKHIPTETQAVIRGLPNTVGIDTRISRTEDWTDTDDNYKKFTEHVDEQIQKAIDMGKPIKVSSGGMGTGKADLPPRFKEYLDNAINNIKTPEIEGETPEAPKGPGRGTMYNVIEPNPKYTGPYAHYIWRTQYNYANSDITFDFTTTGGPSGGGNSAGKGTPDFMKKWNNVPVDNVGRLNINNIDEIAQQFADALTSGQTVNIAGHGNYTSTRGGFPNEVPQSQVDRTVQTIFDKAKELAGDKPFTGKVISGGQSGFDEAGIRVARNIGIPTEVNVQDYTWRDGSGEHVKEEVEFKARIDADGKVPKGPGRGTTYSHGPGGRPPLEIDDLDPFDKTGGRPPVNGEAGVDNSINNQKVRKYLDIEEVGMPEGVKNTIINDIDKFIIENKLGPNDWGIVERKLKNEIRTATWGDTASDYFDDSPEERIKMDEELYIKQIIEETGKTPTKYQVEILKNMDELTRQEILITFRNSITKHGSDALPQLLQKYGATEEFIKSAQYDMADWYWNNIDIIGHEANKLTDFEMDRIFYFAQKKLKELGLSDLEVEGIFIREPFFETNRAFTDPEMRASFDELFKRYWGMSMFEVEDILNEVPDFAKGLDPKGDAKIEEDLLTELDADLTLDNKGLQDLEEANPKEIAKVATKVDMPESAVKAIAKKLGIRALQVLSVFRVFEPVEEAVEYLAQKILQNTGLANTSVGKYLVTKGVGRTWLKAELANLFLHSFFAGNVALADQQLKNSMILFEGMGGEISPEVKEQLDTDIVETYKKYFAPGKTSAWEQLDLAVQKKTGKRQLEWGAHSVITGYDWIKNMFGQEEKYEKVYGGK
jgi:hypothetical protein